MPFLITTSEELRAAGIDRLDAIIVSGDAYVDHPSFGAAMIGRALEAAGFSVGIIPQPDWRSAGNFRRLGRPRLFFGVTAGNVDSMLAHYTVARRLRRDDAYSPGGRAGLRPNRAAIVYASRIREAWPGVPVVLGGIEASLRRLAHYDFWQDAVRRSILLDAKADVLVYGMGEVQIVEIARRLAAGEAVASISDIRGTVVGRPAGALPAGAAEAPSFEECAADPVRFCDAFRMAWEEQDARGGRAVAQRHGDRLVVQNPPAEPLSTKELDALYDLPFERRWHPMYDAAGGVPALETVRFSITSHRGCYGDCSFCALAFHQGRVIQSRSTASILREIAQLARLPQWRGVISDIGGPTANMYMTGCRAGEARRCRRRCLGQAGGSPRPCPNLDADAGPMLSMLEAARCAPGVRKVFIGSGVRFDLCLADASDGYLRELCRHHVSGRLKVAPEHVSEKVLRLMGKPGPEAFEEFRRRFERINAELGKRQSLVCYFMSSHPGCTQEEMRELANYIRRTGLAAEQVQDFYPCPMTPASCMYHTGMHPLTGESVVVARSDRDKQAQRRVLNTPGREPARNTAGARSRPPRPAHRRGS